VPTIAGYHPYKKLSENLTTVTLSGKHPATGKNVVLKLLKGEHPPNERLDRFRAEYTLLSSFDSTAILKTYGLENHQNSLVIILEDWLDDFDPLSEILPSAPFSLEQVLHLAIEITGTLATIHANNIVLRCCNPTGLLISKDLRSVKFIDFSLATEENLPEPKRRDARLPHGILPYISPEQTGRMEQSVDYRSDLYSLGITIFQMATGTLPFPTSNQGELIHAHLASQPPAPDAVNKAIPATVSAIILRLLEKIPARRYQTSHGLLYDLIRCRLQMQQQGTIDAFPLGLRDNYQTLTLPDHLYNRENELEILDAKLHNAAAGQLETICISGNEGVGKSSLVKTFTHELNRNETYYITAKFQRNAAPYSTIAALLRQLTGLILSENPEAINRRKSRIEQELGDEYPALTTTFPATQHLIDPKKIPDQPIRTNDHQLYRALGKFLRVCCETGPVLIIFLDDLHNADHTSLDLLHHVLSSARIGHMLFLCAYRKKAADDESQLKAFFNALAVTNPNIYRLEITNLSLPDIAELVSETLSRNRREIGELAALCLQKTGGNPFFLGQFLKSANRDGHIFFSHTTQRWEWDIAGIGTSHLTRNTAEAARQKITTLPVSTADLLRISACLGESCTIDLVEAMLGHHPDQEMEQAFNEGLMFITECEDTSPPSLHFAHARIREEALQALSPEEHAAIRLRAGRHLLYTLSPVKYSNRIQEIAEYLGGDQVRQIASRTECLEIASVHLDAGRQSAERELFHHAHNLFTTGIKALPATSWQTNYRLTLKLYNSGCESGMRTCNYGFMETCFNKVCTEARTILDSCQVYRLRIQALKAQGLLNQAEAASLKILELLGVSIPPAPSRLESLLSFLGTRLRLLQYSNKRVLSLPEMTDKTALAAMSFLREATSACYTASPRLLPFIASHAIQLSLRYGNSLDSSAAGYLLHGFLLCHFSTSTIDNGYTFGQLALEIQKKYSGKEQVFQSSFAYCNFISHWKKPIRETLPPFQQSLRVACRCGDFESAAHTAYSICYRHYLIGTNLSQLISMINEQLELVRSFNQQLPRRRLEIIAAAVTSLQDTGEEPAFADSSVGEKHLSLFYLDTGDKATYGMALLVKMIHAVLFHDCARALYFSDKIRPCLENLTASALVPVYYFYDSLARLAEYEKQNVKDKLLTRLMVARQQRKMRQWARHAPQNYEHKYLLVEAERKRVLSRRERAMELYDNAIHLAHEHQYIHEEALAYELAARFYDNRKKFHISRLYLREARYCYYRWGATAKVIRLCSPGEHDYATFSPGLGLLPSTDFTPGEGASRLDMLSVIKASRILFSETILDELLKKTMHIMLENGGAEKGALVFKENNEWLIRVWGSADSKAGVTLTNMVVANQDIASKVIINYVANSAKDVVLDNACVEGNFTDDVYVRENKTRSILCTPIVHQGEIFCILYLENNLATGTFPPDRQELLLLLGVQAAISLKNAYLFNKIEHTVGQLNQEIEKRQRTQQQLLHAEKLSALGRLSASIAHEFGNPLMGIKYLLDDFSKRSTLSAGDQDLLDLGLEECDRMKTLIRDLQRLNKPSSGKKLLTDIHQLLDHVLRFQKKHFSLHKITVQTTFDRSIPKVEVIVDQISQVLFNLTMNSVDAMADGGGILSVTTRQEKNTLVVEVADTGSGITRENQERIFEPFFSTKKEEDGTGLGLSISYGIARHHGGNLSFISEPNQGTTFTLSLPLISEQLDEAVMQEMKN